jgi:hypothetical protein
MVRLERNRRRRGGSCVADAWTIEVAEECSCEVIALVLMSRKPRAVGAATLVEVAVRGFVVVDVVVGVAIVDVAALEATGA